MKEAGWQTSPELWAKLKLLARQMRHKPTPAEDTVWQILRNRQLAGLKFRRQHTIDRFIVDFYCREARLVIEVDGPIHQYTAEEDAIRQQFLESTGLQVVRFSNSDVQQSLESVLDAIYAFVTTPVHMQPHPPAPSPQAERGSRASDGGEVDPSPSHATSPPSPLSASGEGESRQRRG